MLDDSQTHTKMRSRLMKKAVGRLISNTEISQCIDEMVEGNSILIYMLQYSIALQLKSCVCLD